MNFLRSLHGRLFVALLLMLGTIWAGIFMHVRSGAAEAAAVEADDRLRSSVAGLLQVAAFPERSARRLPAGVDGRARSVPRQIDVEIHGMRIRAPSFEVLFEDGRTPLRSGDFPAGIGPTPSGFEERREGARTWRVLTVVDRERALTGRVALDDLVLGALAARRDRDAVRPLLWMLPLAAIAALCSIWLGLSPLRRLERSLDAQEPHDLVRLDLEPHRMPRELGRLVTVIERLLSRLRDIHARQRAFTAAAGHELRTPLAGCSVQLQVARRGTDVASRNRALDQARRSIEAMSRLVDQLLLLARADARAHDSSRRRVDLGRLVENVVSRRRPNALDAGIELCLRTDPIEAFVHGNETLLESMVDNLIDNAIKFSPRGAVVDVRVEVRIDEVTLRVIDGGPGIPEEERTRVFDPFHRAAGANVPGNGLGLAIVHGVVADHGGGVWLLKGEIGTEAKVVLPAA